MEVTRSRPLGVTILTILLAIQGVLEVMFGLMALVSVPFFNLYGKSAVVEHISPWGMLIFGILSLALAYSIWTLRAWAAWTMVVLEILYLAGGLLQAFTLYYPGAILIDTIIPAVILIYFFTDKKARSAFQIV